MFHYFTHFLSLLHLKGSWSSQLQPCMARNVTGNTYLPRKHPQPLPAVPLTLKKMTSFKRIRSWRYTAPLDMGEDKRLPRHMAPGSTKSLKFSSFIAFLFLFNKGKNKQRLIN